MPNKVGRPRVKLSDTQLNNIAEMAFNQCHTRTIAGVLGVPEAVLRDNFRALINQKRAEGRAELQRVQREMSEKNPVMAIFRGKNYLDQKDSKDVNVTGEMKVKCVMFRDIEQADAT